MKKSKRLLSLLMALLMMLSLIPMMETEAEAAGSVYVTEQEALQRIDELKTALVGKYFTTTNRTCPNGRSYHRSNHGVCRYCGAFAVVSTSWFQKLDLVSPAKANLMPQHGPGGQMWSSDGDSCYGFANYAGWYIYAHRDSSANVSYNKVSIGGKKTYPLTEGNMKNAVAGDIIRTASGHSMVFVNRDSTGINVLDCNYGSSNEDVDIVRYRHVKYSNSTYITLHRAKNYTSHTCNNKTCNDVGYCSVCKKNYMDSAQYKEDRLLYTGYLTPKSGPFFASVFSTKFRTLPYGASETFNVGVACTKVDVVAQVRNHYGNIWYECRVDGKTCYINVNDVDTSQISIKETISFKDITHPDAAHILGKGKDVEGTVVSSQSKLKSVTAGIYYSDGTKTKWVVTKNPGAKSFDLATINWDIMFSRLTEVGNYYYEISAETEGGTKNSCRYYFSVSKKNTPQYKISFYSNGGSLGTQTRTVYKGTSLSLSSINTPVRDGYTFLGWSAKSGASTAQYKPNGTVKPGGNLELYAVWQAIEPPAAPVLTSLDQKVGTGAPVTVSWRAVSGASTYTVVFYDAEGQAVFTATTAGTSASYLFDTAGSYTARVRAVNAAGESEESAAAAITVMPPATVVFLDHDGSEWARQQVSYGASAAAPASPSRAGYSFDGWDGSLTNVTGDRTLTAKYKPIAYRVTFYDYNGDALATQTVTYDGDTPGCAAEPDDSALSIPSGYVLAGWDTDDWKSVTRDNIKVHPCVVWGNEDLPIETTITSVTKAGDGYWVFYTIQNHVSEAKSGRVVVALKSGFGKFLTRTESGAFYLEGDGSYSGNLYVPVSADIRDETFAMVEAYVVSSYTSLVPISSIAQKSILENDDSDWSAWMTAEEYAAYTGDKSETQTRTEYRSRSRSVSDWMTNEEYLDWQLLDTRTVQSDWGSWSAWQDAAVTADTHTDVETKRVQTAAAYTMYRYGKYISTSAGYGTDGDYYTKGWGHFHQGYYKTGYTLSYSGWSKTRTSPTTKNFGWWGSNNAVKTGTKSGSKYYWNKYKVDGKTYYWEETKTVAATYKTQYRYRTCTDVTQYQYYKWNDWGVWGTAGITAADGLEVETRTMYRVKLPAAEAGAGETISGTVSVEGISDLAGRQAILNIYKVDEASDYSNEYIAQTTLGANGEYCFENVRTYEEPSIKSGDFTVTLTIEGSSGPMVIATDLFRAPKPEYQVTFVDGVDNVQLGQTQTVTEGGSAVAPEAPVKEGYTFLGWDYGLTNIRDNMTIKAVYVPKTFTVVYVDFNNSTIAMQTDVAYGTTLDVADPPAIEGYVFKGWKAEDGADVSCVTRSMIVTAQYDKLSYTVTFLDAEGNVVSTQQIEHGESAEAPETDTLGIPENMYLEDWSEDIWTVTHPMEVTPILMYEEDAPEPAADLASGIYAGPQTVTLPTYDETTILTYRLITESSAAQEAAEDDEPTADGAAEEASIWLDGEGESEEHGDSGERVYTEPITIAESSVLEVTSTKEGTNSVTETYEYIIVPEGSRPAAPTTLAAKAYSDRVELTWDAVEGADGYIIYKSDIYGNQERLMSESSSYADSNVVSITDYTYTVKAYGIYTEDDTQTYLVSDGESPAATVRFYGEQYAVETIEVKAPETLLVGNTVRLYANVSPVNAYDTSVLWSVTNGTGSAAITDSGLLTATAPGTVTVTATAGDGSGVVGTADVTITAASTGVAQLTVDSASVIGGKPFNVSVSLSADSDVTSLQFTLLYDSTLLTLTNAEAGELLADDGPEINTAQPGEVLFLWDSLEGLTKGGSVLELTFAGVDADGSTDTLITIPGKGESEDYEFICTDSTWKEVDCTILNGKVSVLDLGYGDINGDGKVNVLDVSLARRSAARLIELEDWQFAAGDVNGDGKINVADVGLIRRYAAKLITSFPVSEQTT